jgi:glycosyltransferase involved in cell wall biosynthesis
MESFLSDLVHAQRERGEPVMALVHGEPLACDPDWLVRVPVQFQLGFAPVAWGFRATLARLLVSFKPDVLHLHMPNNAVLWCLTLRAARHLPWVVHWHADVLTERFSPFTRAAVAVYSPFEHAVLERADRIVVTSPPYLEASAPLQPWRAKCAVIPLGLQAPSPAPLEAAAAPNPAPWTSGRLRLLAIGRLTYYKDFATLIKAVAGLPHTELLLVGEGELRGELQALIDSCIAPGANPADPANPAVRLLGDVSDAQKHHLLASCDALCLSSNERTEAFGMVLLEAMALGRPCVVSALPGSGMSWLVGSANAGPLVPPGDVPAWQQALAALAANPAQRAQWGRQGQQAFQARFAIEHCAQQLAQQYRLACAPGPGPVPQGGLLIVIPARDEAQTIGALLQNLRAAGWAHVLVIDDHSQDGTGDIARANGAQVLHPVLPLGAWGGMQAGIRYGLAKGFGAVITMDADGQHEVFEIATLMARQSSGDIVIGAFPQRASRLRRLAWEWFRRLTGFDLQDLTSGFRLYNHAAMAVVGSPEATLLDYQDLGALLLARRAGLKIIEVDVTMNLREVGKSRIFNSWFSVLRYMAATTLLCLSRLEFSRSPPRDY